jgi:hypothetical protein
MLTAADTLDHARVCAEPLVDNAKRRLGSRMKAYADVASSVGGTASWMRKLLGRQPDVEIEAHQYLNIVSAYRTLCERVEAQAERERQRRAELMEKADAALEGVDRLVAGAPSAHPRGAEAGSPVGNGSRGGDVA